jgi:hypothetical protein
MFNGEVEWCLCIPVYKDLAPYGKEMPANSTPTLIFVIESNRLIGDFTFDDEAQDYFHSTTGLNFQETWPSLSGALLAPLMRDVSSAGRYLLKALEEEDDEIERKLRTFRWEQARRTKS